MHLELHTATQSEIRILFVVCNFAKISRIHLEFPFQMDFEEMQNCQSFLYCQKLPQIRAYKTSIILLVGAKFMNIIIFNQVDLKRILKKRKYYK